MASDVHHGSNAPLLIAVDPPPVSVINPAGRSPFLLIGDHAGNVIPSSLRSLGVAPADLMRHIAWDIGIGALGMRLAEKLDATFVRQTYSRLVIDCNRHPDTVEAMPTVSDGTTIPGNAALPINARTVRIAAIHEPYHQTIAKQIACRQADDRPTIVIALHSFTPAMKDGIARPWHVGVLHDGGDPRFAHHMLSQLRHNVSIVVGDNEPYRMDKVDYTIPRHCYSTELPYAELEIRQDLITDKAGQDWWAECLASLLAENSV